MTYNELAQICYQKAIQLLRQNSVPEGFVASSATPHYTAVWSRDACITAIGANLTRIDHLVETSKRTLNTLSKLQAPMGQIPVAYWPARSYWDWGDAGSIDGTAWFLIAVWHYYKTTGDKRFLERIYPSVRRTFAWLRCQDLANFGLIDSPEAGDWMDSTLNRCGKVMYVNVLYYCASLAVNALAEEVGDTVQHADVITIKSNFNLLFWPLEDSDYSDLLRHVGYPSGSKVSFPHPCSRAAFHEAAKGRRFYLSHVSFGKFVDVCDVLGNVLAILTDLADHNRKSLILDYLTEKRVSLPYPAKCLPEPITKRANHWGMLKSNIEKFQAPQWRNPPFRYLNGGIWPFIGGFYVLALLKSGRKQLAKAELSRLAQANKLGLKTEWEFHEWINAKTGKPAGAVGQSWNAATYIMAYKVVLEGLPVKLTE